MPNAAQPASHATLIQILEARAAERPTAIGFEFLEEGEVDGARDTLTFGALDARSRAIAALLREHRGERALMVYPPGLPFVTAFFGCLRAGVVAVPAYPPDPSRLGRTLPRLRAIAADAGASLVLTTSVVLSMVELMLPMAPELAALKWVATDIGEAGAESWSGPLPDIADLAFLQYTSGSTGAPKGVMVTHRNMLHNLELGRLTTGGWAGSVAVSWLPQYHDLGLVSAVLAPVYVGARSVLMSPLDFLRRPLRWLAAMSRERGTFSGGPNFAFDLCARKVTPDERAALDLSSWETAFNGAEPIRADTLERFAAVFEPCGFRRAALTPCYGMAETVVGIAWAPAGAGPRVLSARPDALRAGRVEPEAGGRALVSCGGAADLDHHVRIVHPETRRPCGPGEIGEIWVRSPSVAAGYWGRPEESAATFGARLAEGDDGPYLRTGDLGFLDAGELFPVARLKDVVILHGANHHPQDLERTAEDAHPAVRAGCVAAFTDEEDRGLVVVAEVDVARMGNPEAVVAAICAAIAAEHALPTSAVALLKPGAIPKTSSGKIQRRESRSRLADGSLRALHQWAAPRGEAVAAEVVAAPAGTAPTGTAPVVTHAEAAPRAEAAAVPVGTTPALVAPAPVGTTPVGAPPAAAAPSGDAPSADAPSTTALSAFIRAWIAERLRVPPPDDDAALPRLGLDSIVAIELADALQARLGRPVDPGVAWTWPTIGALARALQDGAPAASGRVPLRRHEGPGDAGALSFVERHLFDVMAADPRQEAYDLFVPLRIAAPPEPDRLRSALALLIARHESLRTGFEVVGGEPTRRVAATVDVPLVVRDARCDDEDAAIREACDAVRHHRFDLAAPPLFRAVLLDLGDHGFVALSFNHLVVDAWSLALVQQELATIWRALPGGAPPHLPALPLRPSDYAASANAALRDVLGAAATPAPPARERSTPPTPNPPANAPTSDAWRLPLDAPMPTSPRAEGAVHRSYVDGDLWARARLAAATVGVPPAAVALVAFQVALQRRSGRPDPAFSVVRANRTAPELRPMVACLVYGETFAGRFAEGESWADLLRRAGAALVAEDPASSARDTRLAPPSSRVLFNFHNYDAAAGPDAAPFALDFAQHRYAYVWTTHDLVLQVFPFAGGLHLATLYRSEVLHASSVATLAADVVAGIEAMAADPSAPVG